MLSVNGPLSHHMLFYNEKIFNGEPCNKKEMTHRPWQGYRFEINKVTCITWVSVNEPD